MENLVTILKRELASYFNSAIAYLFIVVFVLITGGIYMTQFFLVGNADMRSFFETLPIVLVVFIPAVTMRLWAEDRKGNTLELLLTFPMRPHELVLGKFFASLLFYAASLAATLPIPMMLFFLGRPDPGPILGGYLGAFFIGSLFLSAGIFVSGLAKDQIVAFIGSILLCFTLFFMGTQLFAGTLDGWIPGLGSFFKNFVGLIPHFESFERGVLDVRDVLYFLIATSAFLLLNGFYLEGRMRPRARVIFSSTIGVSLAILVIFNWLVHDVAFGRADLTEGKIYTVSPAMKELLQSLKAPVSLKYYVSPSEKLPTAMKNIELQVRDKLDELRIASGNQLQYKVFHMEAANVSQEVKEEEEEEEGKKKESLEEKLGEKGIVPFQVGSIERDELGVKLVYSALSVAYKERQEEILPRVIPDTLADLEYELASKIYRMTLDRPPSVALLAPIERQEVDPALAEFLMQFGQEVPTTKDHYRYLGEVLRHEGYLVNRVKFQKDSLPPEGAGTLFVIQPKELNQRQKFEINRFLVEGKSVLVAGQFFNFSYSSSPRRGMEVLPARLEIPVNSLLKSWGVEIDPALLMDESSEILTVSGGARIGPFEIPVPVKAPIQILVKQNSMNQEVSLTNRLEDLFYLWGSALKLDESFLKEHGIKATILFSSSKNSWESSGAGYALGPRDFEPSRYTGPYPLAVLLEGRFPNAFQEKRYLPAWPEDSGKEKAASVTAEEEGERQREKRAKGKKREPLPELKPRPGKLLVVGCSKMFENEFLTARGNLPFFMNAVDSLALSDLLIQIRSKRQIDRSMPEVSGAAKVWYRFFVILFVPILVAVIGTMRAFMRKREKEKYLALVREVAV